MASIERIFLDKSSAKIFPATVVRVIGLLSKVIKIGLSNSDVGSSAGSLGCELEEFIEGEVIPDIILCLSSDSDITGFQVDDFLSSFRTAYGLLLVNVIFLPVENDHLVRLGIHLSLRKSMTSCIMNFILDGIFDFISLDVKAFNLSNVSFKSSSSFLVLDISDLVAFLAAVGTQAFSAYHYHVDYYRIALLDYSNCLIHQVSFDKQLHFQVVIKILLNTLSFQLDLSCIFNRFMFNSVVLDFFWLL
ncbi:hypothetical protein AGLY_004179, partial [Aphis glycines]